MEKISTAYGYDSLREKLASESGDFFSHEQHGRKKAACLIAGVIALPSSPLAGAALIVAGLAYAAYRTYRIAYKDGELWFGDGIIVNL